MANNDWKWADLDDKQLRMLNEGEQTLGADILLAYQQEGPAMVHEDMISDSGLQVASLNDSQLECLQGLEKNMQTVVIAYQKTRM